MESRDDVMQAGKNSKQTTLTGLTEKIGESASLDLVFIMDSTGSMGSYIKEAQNCVRGLIEGIVAAEKCDVRFALVSYRDHPPQDSSYVTKKFEFTSDTTKMRQSLFSLSASGGGDGPEAVADGLHEAMTLEWREQATKIAILVADAPPHGLGCGGDGFPNGCPLGHDPIAIAREYASRGITLNMIGCEPAVNPYKEFYMALCFITGGQYCPLASSQSLSQAVLGGAREEIGLERIMRSHDISARPDESESAHKERVHHMMKQAQVRTTQVQYASSALPKATPRSVAMASAMNLSDMRIKCGPAISMTVHVPMASSSAMRSSFASPRMARMAPSSAAAPPTVDACLGYPAMPEMPMPMAAAMSATSGPAEYSVGEDEVSMEQVERMITKSKARRK